MADPAVKIIMSLVNKVSGEMSKIVGSFKLGTSALTDLNSAMMIADKVFGYVKKAIDATVGVTVEYNKTIREMTQVTGLGAESISRIVQVGDDWGISIDAIRTSLAFMNKQGITPSIDNIAKLADEYVNTADKSAFAEKAVKILGRGYQTLIPLLALGGDGFRDAAAGIDESLIATDEAMKASREYEVATDDLADTMLGLKYTAGNVLIPVLSDLMQILNGNYDAALAAEDGISTLDEAMTNLEKGIDGLGWAWKDYQYILYVSTHGLQDMIKTGRTYEEELQFARNKIFGVRDALIVTREELWLLDKGERDNITTTDNLAFAFDSTLAGALSDAREDMGGMTDNEISAQIVGLQGLIKAADEYSTALQGLTTDALTGMTEGMGELMRKQALLTYFQTLNAIPAGAANAAQLKAQALQVYNLATANGYQLSNMEKLIKANDEKKISDIDMMAIMADNIVTNEELTTALAKTAGEATAVATNTGNATKALHDYDGTTANAYINTYHNDIYTVTAGSMAPTGPPPGPGYVWNGQEWVPGGAKGLDMVVPSGYDNDKYPIMASSGERVVIIPKSQQNSVVNNNNFSMNIHTNAQASSLMRDFNKMRAWVG